MRVIHYGLGPIGRGIAELVLERGHTIVGAIDTDPRKAGEDLGRLLKKQPLGLIVSDKVDEVLSRPADIVVHATGSRLASVLPQLVTLLEAGLDVASTCEELAFPWHHHPQEARRLDDLARQHDATIIGLGVNPGFVMDLMPIMLTAPCRDVRRIIVERALDAGQRREALRRKVGAGESRQDFAAGVNQGRLGHVGLVESVAMIADALGWAMADISEEIRPALAADGSVAGIHQVAKGIRATQPDKAGGKSRKRDGDIVLDLTMSVGLERPHDTVTVEGIPTVRMTIAGGIHGDLATWAIVANALPLVEKAEAGLLCVPRLPLLHLTPETTSPWHGPPSPR